MHCRWHRPLLPLSPVGAAEAEPAWGRGHWALQGLPSQQVTSQHADVGSDCTGRGAPLWITGCCFSCCVHDPLFVSRLWHFNHDLSRWRPRWVPLFGAPCASWASISCVLPGQGSVLSSFPQTGFQSLACLFFWWPHGANVVKLVVVPEAPYTSLSLGGFFLFWLGVPCYLVFQVTDLALCRTEPAADPSHVLFISAVLRLFLMGLLCFLSPFLFPVPVLKFSLRSSTSRCPEHPCDLYL